MQKKVIKRKNNAGAIFRDVAMVGIGIVIAIILSKIGIIDYIIYLFKDYYAVTAFLAGLFFTSIFTLAPASITLIHLSQGSPILGVVLWGSLGAACGDMILLFFIKDRFVVDFKKYFRPHHIKYFMKSMHFGFMRWLSPIIGALLIASPLPDEFGITLLGMSKIKTIILIPITFFMNILGIYLLIQFSHLL